MKIKIKETVKAKKGWSLYKLAKVLNLPQQTVYSWASGRTQPSYENMDKLCETISCTVVDLFEAEPVQQKLNLAVNQYYQILSFIVCFKNNIFYGDVVFFFLIC